jgi:ketosteroid isomerase-like protein
MESISESLQGFLDAFSNLNLDKMMEYFDEEATAFFPIKHEREKLQGKQKIKDTFSNVINKISNAGLNQIKLDAEAIEITDFGDSALVTFLIHDNELNRRTLVLKRKNGRWLIFHLHASNAPLNSNREDES